jgi:hypothetical protein
MSKLIIENGSKIGDEEALQKVIEVIRMGRISGEGEKAQYCYYTRLVCSYGFCGVIAFLNKASDRFVVRDCH